MSRQTWEREVRERWEKFRWWALAGIVAAVLLIVAGVVAGNKSEGGGEGGGKSFTGSSRDKAEGAGEVEEGAGQPSHRVGGCTRSYAAEPGMAEGPRGGQVPTLHLGCSDLGATWPLSVKEGLLQCEEEEVAGLIVQRVTFETPSGSVYAVNGHALDAGYPDITPIWKKDPSGVAPRLNIGPLIDRGLTLCEEAG